MSPLLTVCKILVGDLNKDLRKVDAGSMSQEFGWEIPEEVELCACMCAMEAAFMSLGSIGFYLDYGVGLGAFTYYIEKVALF